MFTREDKNSKIKPKQSMHIKSRSNKTNEWPLMSTPINKSMPRKRLLKMRINEKIINYRSRTWKASSQAKALLTSSSVSRSLRKNPLPNISFLPPFPARSRVFFSKSQLALPPHQSTSLAKQTPPESQHLLCYSPPQHLWSPNHHHGSSHLPRHVLHAAAPPRNPIPPSNAFLHVFPKWRAG